MLNWIGTSESHLVSAISSLLVRVNTVRNYLTALYFLPLLLKTAGFRRGGLKRKSSRSKRWSKSAQTIFASWAVLGQISGMSLMVAEVIEP